MIFEINDLNFNIAIARLIKLIRRNFKHKVSLAIKIISDESGFTQKELAFELYRRKILKSENHYISNV
jgi:hypothetical protein